MNFFQTIRGVATGSLNESALQNVQSATGNDDISEYENDEQFMQECTADLMAMMIQGMILGEIGRAHV